MSQNLLYIRRYNSNKTMDAIDKDDIDEDEDDDDDGRPRHGSNTSGQSARLGNFLTNSRQPMTLITPSHRGSRGSRGVFLSFSINSLTSGNILSTTQFSSSEASRGAIYDDPEDLTPPTPLPPHPFFKAPSKGQGQQKDKKTEREIKMEIEELQAQLDQMKKEKVKLLSEFSGSVYGQDENGESGINSFEGRPSEKGIDHADKVRENEVHAPLKSNDSEIPISKLLKKDSYSSKTEFNQEDFLKHLWCSPSSGAKGSGGVWRDVKENEPEISNKIHQRPKHTPNAIVNSFDGQFKCLDSDSEIMDDGVFENKFPEVDTMQDLEEITLPANPNIPHTRSRKTTGYLYNKHNSFDSSDSIQADVKSNSISHHDDVPGKNPSASETLPEDKSPLVLQENKSHSVLPDSKRPSILPEYKSPSEQSDESFIRPDLPPLKYPEHSPSPESDHITQLPPKKKSQDIPFESSPSQTTEYDDDENTRYQDYNDSNKASYSNATGSSHHNVSRYAGYMSSLQSLADHHGYIIKDVTPDGNCMFSAIIDQLRIQGNFDLTPNSLRKTAVDYLKENPKNQDGTHLESFLSTETWEEYLKRMGQESQWGDHMVLQACTEVTGQKIVVFKPNANKTVLVPTVEKASEDNTVTLGHIGESHFVSLRPKDWEANWPLMAQAHRVKKKEKQKLTKKKILERKKADKLKKISTPESSVRGESTSVDEKELTGTEETEGTTLEVLTDKKPVEEEDDEGDEDEEDDSQFKTTDELIELVKNREAIDSRSGMPLYHMSFIIQTLVREENMVKGGNENACETYIGSRAENMKICLQHSRREYLGAECCEKGYLSLCEYRSVQISADTLAVPSPEKARDMDVVMIETEPIRPGYVRLQTMSPQLHKGHTFWIDETTALLKKHTKRQQTGNRDIIIHQGIKCLEWPESACEWISRPRPSGWPGQRFIESVIESGCMAISRSHPFSYKREVEWQLLFPCAETILATEALTDAQRYCMNVFKILVDFHLRDFSIRLKTTTFKTIVYYACEILPMDAWEQNISGCLMYLLDKLYVHLNKKWLPNYFIPTNNMYDHLTEYEPLAHSIYGLRSYLAMGIYFLADHHGVRQMSAFDAALEDIKEYRNHRNVRRSYHDVLLPNLLQLASAYIWNEWYPFAGRVLHSAFQEVLAVAEENEEVPAFEDFVKKVLATEDTVDRRYMFRYMDRYYGTSLGKNVESTEEMARFKDIEGIGDLQQFHNETIPRNCLGDTVLELTYIIPVVERLRKEHKFSDAVCLLQIVIKKGKHFRDGFMVPDVVDDPVLKQDLIKQSELPRTLVNTCLMISYQRLFNCLSEIGEVDTFTEHLQDYEDICYDLDSNETLRNVAHIWEIFGNNKKAQELRQKATQSRTEKAERLARAIMLILSGAAGKSLSSTLQQFI